MTPMYPGCTATGTPTAGAPIWTTTTRFCATTLRGGGCAAGSACVPAIPNTPQRCVMTAGSRSCPAATQRTDWYTTYTGNFTCNPCSCGEPSGASCAGARIVVGSNGGCTNQTQVLGSGQSFCSPTGIANPGIVFTGVPTAPTCVPMNSSSGSLSPSGPQTICCL
jgi:hypothetical protein